MPNIDLSSFRPQSVEDLYQGMLTSASAVVVENFEAWKKEVSIHMKAIADKAWTTKIALQRGTITREDADIALHTQELAFSGALLFSEFIIYDTVQDVLNAVFRVISAAIKNLTGFEIKFG